MTDSNLPPELIEAARKVVEENFRDIIDGFYA